MSYADIVAVVIRSPSISFLHVPAHFIRPVVSRPRPMTGFIYLFSGSHISNVIAAVLENWSYY
jgi:hypothetical protein